jgi:two-component system, cell cycle sensor histidine kinase and response regulator CckA
MEARRKVDLPPSLELAETSVSDPEIRFRSLFETAQDGILILDGPAGLITDVNPSLIALLGYSREELIGKTLWDIGPCKNIEASRAAFLELKDKGYVHYDDLPLEAKSGHRVSVEFVSNVYGVNGGAVIQCNVRDITAQKLAERTDEHVRQSQKMEALGQLAGGVAHDFNNLLGVILGYCELLEDRIAPEDSTRKMIEQIHIAGNHATTLTRQLLAFSRRQVLRPVVLDLNALVTGMEPMLRRLIGDDVVISTVLSPELGLVKADPSQIEQILMNLAVNARDAMPDGGKIELITANAALDHDALQVDFKPGSYVMLAVSDDGIGMDGETKERIFEPFFTTKMPSKGTGLGLSMVYGIVKQSSGYIYAYSEPGRGTTFKVYLPSVPGGVLTSSHEGMSSARGGKETILLVEDNDLLREMTRVILEGLGYTVLDSGHPFEATRIAESYAGKIDLLLTDLVMPEVRGNVLAKTLSALRPEMKVLLTSGYVGVEQLDIKLGCAFLEKPFSRDMLAKRIRQLLDPAN